MRAKKFLQFAINQNLADYFGASHGGAGLAHIKKERFEESALLQPDTNEQRRIVAEIEKQFTRLEAGVAALRRVQTSLKRYRAAVLKAVCEGQLVPSDAEPRRTADHADGTDGKRKIFAASAKSAVKTPGYETGAELLTRLLAEQLKSTFAT